MFKSKKNAERFLAVPSEVVADAKAREVLRAWVANGGLVCALRPETWADVVAWGIVLADVTRHVANAVKDLRGDDPTATVTKMREAYNSELADPTAEPTGSF